MDESIRNLVKLVIFPNFVNIIIIGVVIGLFI